MLGKGDFDNGTKLMKLSKLHCIFIILWISFARFVFLYRDPDRKVQKRAKGKATVPTLSILLPDIRCLAHEKDY